MLDKSFCAKPNKRVWPTTQAIKNGGPTLTVVEPPPFSRKVRQYRDNLGL